MLDTPVFTCGHFIVMPHNSFYVRYFICNKHFKEAEYKIVTVLRCQQIYIDSKHKNINYCYSVI